jgi:murein DD-endopeptidase MepM/ murein hydrolase activator NlpD
MIYRPHLGVDYAAAEGTPVVAAGDGVIRIKRWVNGFGNYIEIIHDFGLSTGYGHLSRFAKGIVEGRRVLQGQVIGYVGATGVATGPHLDYRVKKNNRFVNPLRMTVPASPPVKHEYMEELKAVVTERMATLNRPIEMKLYVLNE